MTVAGVGTPQTTRYFMSESPPHHSAAAPLGTDTPVRTGARIRSHLRYRVGVLACCAAVAGLGTTAAVTSAKDPAPAPGVVTADDHPKGSDDNSGRGNSGSGSDDSSGHGRGRGSDDAAGSGTEPGDDNGGSTTTVEPGDDKGTDA